MSAQVSLDFSKSAPLCRCGHEVDAHAKGRGICMTCGVDCHRYRSRVRVKVSLPEGLAAPAAAVALMRPDTKRPKAMGWVLVTATTLVAFLDGLETKSPNVYKQIAQNFRLAPARKQQIMAGLANEAKAQRERALAALETVHREILDRGLPARIVLTRVSTGKLDADNAQGALKHVRDGVAEGLLVDDRAFDDERCRLVYEQAAPGKRGVKGVKIELDWRPA